MLVLSRHIDEEIVIGDDITVIVVSIRADKVRLGVRAPQDVSVHRREVYEAIRREERLAEAKAEEAARANIIETTGEPAHDPLPRVKPDLAAAILGLKGVGLSDAAISARLGCPLDQVEAVGTGSRL
jgi:carbon storage regulator